MLHSLRPAGAQVAIVLPEPVAVLPGFLEMLQQFVGCELIVVPEGFAAAVRAVVSETLEAGGDNRYDLDVAAKVVWGRLTP